MFAKKKHRAKKAFTLIELVLSLSIYTSLLVIALIGILGIFGIYNKTQGLTRSQQSARGALDVLIRDLRETKVVEDIPGVQAGRCLTNPSSGFKVGYGYVQPAPGSDRPNDVFLARVTNCDMGSFANSSVPPLVIGPDVWIDKTSTAFPESIFRIDKLTLETDSAKSIWRVRVGAFRGNIAPTMLGFDPRTERFNSGSVQEAVVVSRAE